MKPWHILDINTSNALSNYGINYINDLKEKFRASNDSIGLWVSRDLNIFNADWLDNLTNMGLSVSQHQVFFRSPGFIYPTAHIDMTVRDGIQTYTPIAFNWVINDPDDSEMVWYKTPNILPELEISSVGTPYLGFDPTKLELLDKHTIGKQFTMVKTDIPHNIFVNKQERCAISLRLKEPLAWDDALQLLRPFILE